MEGAIVRLQPPAGVKDERLSELEMWLKRSGVAKVRIGSQAQADVAPEPKDCLPQQSRRELIMGMAETSKRKDELKVLLDLELKMVKM